MTKADKTRIWYAKIKNVKKHTTKSTTKEN
jgi:hypothetical protein